jgi:hypothetical protein
MHGKYVLSHGMKTWSGTVNKGARLALRREKMLLSSRFNLPWRDFRP